MSCSICAKTLSLKKSTRVYLSVAIFSLVLSGCSKSDIESCLSAVNQKGQNAQQLKQSATGCWDGAKQGLTSSVQAGRQLASIASANSPTLFFERQGGWSFVTGTKLPSGVAFSLSNEGTTPISKITYVLDIVGDGEIIATTELTSQLIEMLKPGQTTTVSSPVKIDGHIGQVKTLFTAKNIEAKIRLTKAQ